MSDRGDFPIGYCALEYRAPDNEVLSTDLERIILIATKLRRGELSIKVHPDWHKIAIPEDHAYLQAIFDDFAERTRLDPESLLKQLSTLSVGPLQTYDVGQMLADRPDLLQLFDRFKEI